MTTPFEQRRYHEEVDPHVHGRWLSDVVLGAQDGLVNTLGVVLGVAAASSDPRVTFATGMAAGLAEAISMAAVGYTSSLSRGELFASERARERRHLASSPDIERAEVRALYAGKGFSGPLLDRVVDTICADPEVWVAVMMSEEHGLAPVDRRASLRSAGVIGTASLVGAVVPVLPFAMFARDRAILAAVLLGAVGLFALGAFKARVTAGRKARSGIVLALIGCASAAAGYVVGLAFAQ